MRYISLIFSLLVLTECTQSPEEVVPYPKIDCEAIGYIDVQRWRNEVLSLDSMTINGNFPLISTIDDYRKEFGSVSRTYNVEEEDIALYGSLSDRKTRYVFKGALVDKWGDEAIINMLDFTLNDVEIVHPRIVLKKGMRISELSKLFPRSCRLVPAGGNKWGGFVVLSAGSDDWRRVVLTFRTEKLIKIKIVNFKTRVQ